MIAITSPSKTMKEEKIKIRTTKPRLIEIIRLGLLKEIEIENNLNGFSNLDDAVGQLLPKFKELEEKVRRLEEQNK